MRTHIGFGLGVWALLVGAGLWPRTLRAQERPAVEGHVVELSEQDIVLDLAHRQGATDGVSVELWRPLAVKNPLTGEVVTDRFLIGKLKLVQVRDVLSLARADGKLARAAQPGDVVILRSPRGAPIAGSAALARPVPSAAAAQPAGPTPAAAPATEASDAAALEAGTRKSDKQESLNKTGKLAAAATGAATCESSKLDAEASEVSQLFDGLRGQSPRTRILAYENYVKRHPSGRYALVLYEEAQHLRKLVGLLSQGEPVEVAPTKRSFEPPLEALAGSELQLGIELNDAAGAVLHSRHEGEVAYVSTPMKPAGDGYFVASLARERVRPSGLEYFIEATTPSGNASAVVGTTDNPETFRVNALPAPKPPEHHDAVASLSTDYADWNNWKGNDVVWQTEGFVGMRLSDIGVRAVRTGFGVYRGVGGSLNELDVLHLDGRAVGLTYGYLEGEFGLTHFTGLIGRLAIGLEDNGVAGGAQLLLRLGNDRETNLQIGGEVLGSVGMRGITQLELNTFPRFPMLFRTEVTNQPAGVSRIGQQVRPSQAGILDPSIAHEQGEVGARAIAQVGYRVLPSLVVSVRGSYQGRTINHAGPGFGGAVSYQW